MNIVVTGGGTVAPIDDVRHIANVSTGRFSSEISEAFLKRGADVTHIHAPSAILPFQKLAKFDLNGDQAEEITRLHRLRQEYDQVQHRLRLRPIGTGRAREYAEVLRSELVERRVDAVLLAMAVSDYEPEPAIGKIGSNKSSLILTLYPTPKVIQQVRDWSPQIYLVGFKLLSGSTEQDLIETARRACIANHADLTIANDLKSIRQGRHLVHLVGPEGLRKTIGPAEAIADGLADYVLKALKDREAGR